MIKKSYLIAIISVVILLILLGAGYWYMQSVKNKVNVIPLVSTNPLDNKPNINPVDQANPFANIKINPF